MDRPLLFMFTLIENAEVYAPRPLGRQSVLVAKDEIVRIGAVERTALESLGIEFQVIDGEGCYLTPGLIDPHEHLLGGSGESGFASQTPEIAAGEIVSAGITTVVGCLGADTTTKTLPGLLAKVKALKEEGLNAFMWTGGYGVPTPSITSKAPNDLLFIDEVIGIGEIAIADERSSDPEPGELAKLIHETHVAGTLSKTSGLTHIHVGEKPERLKLLRQMIGDNGVGAEWLYVTHITRSEELMNEAIDLARRGSWIDMDTVDENLGEWLEKFVAAKGPLDKLTFSTDASIASPHNLFGQIRSCFENKLATLEQLLSLVTINTATALNLPQKGRIEVGAIADMILIERDGFNLRDVVSKGRLLMRDGTLQFREQFLEGSNRKIVLEGDAAAA